MKHQNTNKYSLNLISKSRPEHVTSGTERRTMRAGRKEVICFKSYRKKRQTK